MIRISRVISRPTKKSEMACVECTDGKTTWTSYINAEDLQKHDLKSQLIAQGANESLLIELCDLCYSQGYEDGRPDIG